jgi:hypothetical protein
MGTRTASEGVKLVDEDDAGCGVPRLLEKVATLRRANTDEYFDKFRTGYREERQHQLRRHRSRAGSCRLRRNT